MKLDKYTVGKRYGKALFELAVEKNQAEAIYQELLTLAKSITKYLVLAIF